MDAAADCSQRLSSERIGLSGSDMDYSRKFYKIARTGINCGSQDLGLTLGVSHEGHLVWVCAALGPFHPGYSQIENMPMERRTTRRLYLLELPYGKDF